MMIALKKRPAYTYILLVLDWLTIVAALAIGITLRGREFGGGFSFVGAPLEWEPIFLCLFGAAATLLFQYLGLYRVNVFITVADQTVRILKALFFTILSLALLAFFVRAEWIVDSRLAMVYFSAISIILLVGGLFLVGAEIFLPGGVISLPGKISEQWRRRRKAPEPAPATAATETPKS